MCGEEIGVLVGLLEKKDCEFEREWDVCACAEFGGGRPDVFIV
jgi:hypothetical protein